MENLFLFVDNTNVPLVTHHDEDLDDDYNDAHEDDYDDYKTQNTTVEETTFATPSSINKQGASTSHLLYC